MKRNQLLITLLCMSLNLIAMQRSVSLILEEEPNGIIVKSSQTTLNFLEEDTQEVPINTICPEMELFNSMENEQSFMVEIVDQDSDKHLVSRLIANSSTYIFGATPRYALFVRFIQVLIHHLTLLNQHFDRSRALKGVSKEIKTIFKELKTKNPEVHPADSVKALSLCQKMKLFFVLGFQQKQLKDNFLDLGASMRARDKNKQILLIHVLLPCYLDGCTELYSAPIEQDFEQNSEIPLTSDKLRLFLHESALFYKSMHEESLKKGVKVHIVLPESSYFEEMGERVKHGPLSTNQKEESICTILRKEILSHTMRLNSTLVIVNQNPQEIGSLIRRLVSSGINRPMLDGLYLTIRVGIKPTTVFNPYSVSPTESNDEYMRSSLIKKELLSFLLEGKKNEAQL